MLAYAKVKAAIGEYMTGSIPLCEHCAVRYFARCLLTRQRLATGSTKVLLRRIRFTHVLSTSATATSALLHALAMFLGSCRPHLRTRMAYTLATRRLHNLQLKLGIATLRALFQLWHR
jgi:hypothetical protein